MKDESRLSDEAAEYPPGTWLTVCHGCNQLVPGIFHVTTGGQRMCYDCTPVPDRGESEKKYVPVGPAAPEGSACGCGAAAVAQCHGCGTAFCEPCWHRHSHTAGDRPQIIAPAAERREPTELMAPDVLRLVEFDELWRYLWLDVGRWRRLDDVPCPVCRTAGTCSTDKDRERVFCAAVESPAGARARDGRRGWVHTVRRPRRKGVAA